MPSLEDWVEWSAFIGFFVAGAVAVLQGLQITQLSNKLRVLFLLCVFAPFMAIYGAMAQGQGDLVRADSVTVVIARYGVQASVLGFFGAFMTLSIVPNYFLATLSAVLVAASNLALLLGARSVGSEIWYYFIWAGAAFVAHAVLALLTRVDRSGEHAGMSSTLDMSQEWTVKLAAIFVPALYLTLYIIDQAWIGVVSRFVSSLLYALVNVIALGAVGNIVLYMYKPEPESNTAFNFSLNLEQGNAEVTRPLQSNISGAGGSASTGAQRQMLSVGY